MFHYSKHIEIPCLYQPSCWPSRLEGQHPRRNCQYTRWYDGEGHGKHQKSVYSVYGQWGTSPTWCNFENIVKQNFKCVSSLWNKNTTFMINKTSFIAFWKKEVMLPHPLQRGATCYMHMQHNLVRCLTKIGHLRYCDCIKNVANVLSNLTKVYNCLYFWNYIDGFSSS